MSDRPMAGNAEDVHPAGRAAVSEVVEPSWKLIPPGVWQSKLVSADECRILCDEINKLKQSDGQVQEQLLPEHGLPLKHICPSFLEQIVQQTQVTLVAPRKPHARLELDAAFAIEYDCTQGHTHQPHADDSDLTLNLCIGAEFTGGGLLLATDPLSCNEVYSLLDRYRAGDQRANTEMFLPIPDAKLDLEHRLMPTEPSVSLDSSLGLIVAPMFIEVEHTVGHALIHPGSHVHGAGPVTAGLRMNVVCWLRLVMEFQPWLRLSHNLMQLILSRYCSVHSVCLFAQTSRLMCELCSSEELWCELTSRSQFDCTVTISKTLMPPGRARSEPRQLEFRMELDRLPTTDSGLASEEMAASDDVTFRGWDLDDWTGLTQAAAKAAHQRVAEVDETLEHVQHPSRNFRRLRMLSDAAFEISNTKSLGYSEQQLPLRHMIKCLPDPIRDARNDLRHEVSRIKHSPACVVRACPRWLPDPDLFPGACTEVDSARVQNLLMQYLDHASQRALDKVIQRNEGRRPRFHPAPDFPE